jgi:hypothetical protein
MVQGVTPRRGTAHGDVCAVKSLSLDSSDTGRASTNSGSVYNFPKHRTGLLCYFPPKNRVFFSPTYGSVILVTDVTVT